ncbi:MAG: metal-dependent hydrolase [Thermoplasmata archaeon]|nr:MAG: metal-dependent hydrolase [Thermoplasmata archaeon]
MFLFGHIGITMAAIYLLAVALSSLKKNSGHYGLLVKELDFRLVVITAMLPDIIDKIVGMVILKEEIANGRIYSHTILGFTIISICLFIAVKLRTDKTVKTALYILPLWIHLVLDRMWENLHTLFWPSRGFSFPKLDIEFSDYFPMLVSEPYIFLGEILGIVVILFLFIKHRLLNPKRFVSFIRSGILATEAEDYKVRIHNSDSDSCGKNRGSVR